MRPEQALFRAKTAPSFLFLLLFRISLVMASVFWIVVFVVFAFPEAGGEATTPLGRFASVAAATIFTYPIYHYLFKRRKITVNVSHLKLGEDNIHWSLVDEVRVKKMSLGAPRNADMVIVKTKDMAERKFYLFIWDASKFHEALEKVRTQNPSTNFSITVERPFTQTGKR